MNQLTIKAAAGLRVPTEGNARRYITETTPVTVTDSAYYRRLLASGDVVLSDNSAETEAQLPSVKAEVNRGKS